MNFSPSGFNYEFCFKFTINFIGIEFSLERFIYANEIRKYAIKFKPQCAKTKLHICRCEFWLTFRFSARNIRCAYTFCCLMIWHEQWNSSDRPYQC